jgi:hypothetical protein
VTIEVGQQHALWWGLVREQVGIEKVEIGIADAQIGRAHEFAPVNLPLFA